VYKIENSIYKIVGMSYIYKLVIRDDEENAYYYAKIENLSNELYELFTDSLFHKEIPYNGTEIRRFVSPETITEALSKEETIYNKHHVTAKIIGELKVSMIKLSG